MCLSLAGIGLVMKKREFRSMFKRWMRDNYKWLIAGCIIPVFCAVISSLRFECREDFNVANNNPVEISQVKDDGAFPCNFIGDIRDVGAATNLMSRRLRREVPISELSNASLKIDELYATGKFEDAVRINNEAWLDAISMSLEECNGTLELKTNLNQRVAFYLAKFSALKAEHCYSVGDISNAYALATLPRLLYHKESSPYYYALHILIKGQIEGFNVFPVAYRMKEVDVKKDDCPTSDFERNCAEIVDGDAIKGSKVMAILAHWGYFHPYAITESTGEIVEFPIRDFLGTRNQVECRPIRYDPVTGDLWSTRWKGLGAFSDINISSAYRECRMLNARRD